MEQLNRWKLERRLPQEDEESESARAYEEQPAEPTLMEGNEVHDHLPHLCQVCGERFKEGNQLQFDYDRRHAVNTPAFVTTMTHQCKECKAFFSKTED